MLTVSLYAGADDGGDGVVVVECTKRDAARLDRLAPQNARHQLIPSTNQQDDIVHLDATVVQDSHSAKLHGAGDVLPNAVWHCAQIILPSCINLIEMYTTVSDADGPDINDLSWYGLAYHTSTTHTLFAHFLRRPLTIEPKNTCRMTLVSTDRTSDRYLGTLKSSF